MSHHLELTDEQLTALKGMVGSFIDEGWTTPPYPSEYYDIFEMIGLDPDEWWQYDIRRPDGETE